jgi:hypothetical protein
MRKVCKSRATSKKSRRAASKKRSQTKRGRTTTRRRGSTTKRSKTRTKTRTTRRKRISYKLSEWDYMPDAPSNCGDICYAWHKNNNKYRYSNPRKIVDAFKAVERTPKYEACCAPDRPLNLMEDLSDLAFIASGKGKWGDKRRTHTVFK